MSRTAVDTPTGPADGFIPAHAVASGIATRREQLLAAFTKMPSTARVWGHVLIAAAGGSAVLTTGVVLVRWLLIAVGILATGPVLVVPLIAGIFASVFLSYVAFYLLVPSARASVQGHRYMDCGRLLLEVQQYGRAADALERALEFLLEAVKLDPNERIRVAWVRCDLAKAYLGLQRYGESAAQYRAVLGIVTNERTRTVCLLGAADADARALRLVEARASLEMVLKAAEPVAPADNIWAAGMMAAVSAAMHQWSDFVEYRDRAIREAAAAESEAGVMVLAALALQCCANGDLGGAMASVSAGSRVLERVPVRPSTFLGLMDVPLTVASSFVHADNEQSQRVIAESVLLIAEAVVHDLNLNREQAERIGIRAVELLRARRESAVTLDAVDKWEQAAAAVLAHVRSQGESGVNIPRWMGFLRCCVVPGDPQVITVGGDRESAEPATSDAGLRVRGLWRRAGQAQLAGQDDQALAYCADALAICDREGRHELGPDSRLLVAAIHERSHRWPEAVAACEAVVTVGDTLPFISVQTLEAHVRRAGALARLSAAEVQREFDRYSHALASVACPPWAVTACRVAERHRIAADAVSALCEVGDDGRTIVCCLDILGRGLKEGTEEALDAILAADSDVTVAQYLVHHDRTTLIVARSGQNAPQIFELPMPAARVESLLMLIYEEVESYEAWRNKLEELWQEVARDLVAPLFSLVSPGSLLYLIPHGPLARVPLHAVPVDGRFLIDTTAVVYGTSVADAARLIRRREPPFERAVVIGNPYGDLPGAQEEARHVSRMFGTSPLLFGDALITSLAGSVETDVLQCSHARSV